MMTTTSPPRHSLVAAAIRLLGRKRSAPQLSAATGGAAPWAAEAWEMYDLVGELRFIANLLANRMGQARLYVGEVQSGGTPEEIDDPAADETLRTLGDDLPAILTRLGLQLFVADGGYLCGIPRVWLEDGYTAQTRAETVETVDPDGIEWAALSTSEASVRGGDTASVRFRGVDFTDVPQSDLFLVRVWRPHPRDYLDADSPVRSSLPVLRELVGLTKHVSAQVDSRLAGAGVLFVPTSIEQTMGDTETDDQDSAFSASLTEAMMTAIEDRDSAAAVVPLVVGVPPDDLEHIRHITMAGSLDAEARPLRDEAIRRLALGLDAPPEVLLGQGGMNHWGAWLVDEQTVSSHLEPPLALICSAITEQIFRPLMAAQGRDASGLVVWYDTSQLSEPVSRLADSLLLYDRGLVPGDVPVREAGYDPGALGTSSQPPAPQPEPPAPGDEDIPAEPGPPASGPPV